MAGLASFFSAAGQKQRLSNVVSTFSAIGKNVASVFTDKVQPVKINATTGSKTVNKALEVVANNPFKTAAVAGTVAVAARVATGNAPGITSAAKKVVTKAKNVVSKNTSKPGITTAPAQATAKATAPTAMTPVAPTGGVITPAGNAGISTSPRKTTSVRRRSSKPKRSTRRTSKRRRTGYGTEKAYKRKGGKKVYYTKNKQPYVLLSSGKARFIKKSKRR